LDRVNHVSLNIGDYEALKQAAIDPYIAVRDAYMQYRTQRIRRWGDTEIKPKDFRESGTK
jgi:ABC-type transporter lipoprotein component MlaA